MLYRDFMQKFRPLYAADGVAGDGAAAAAAASSTVAEVAAPQVEVGASAAPAADAVAAVVAAEPVAESAPSLIEGAQGKPDSKPKPEAEAAKPADGSAVKDPAKDEPAPAEAAKTDAEKAAEAAGDKPKPDAEKTAEEKAADATDPAKDATAEAQPPAPIKYEAFKMPDGIKLDDERIGKFAEIAGPAQVPQEIAQKLIDLHIEEMTRLNQEAQTNALANQRKSWNTYVDSITTDLRKDPEVGGNRLETSLSMAKAVVEEYLPANEAAEYLALLTHNGMGNHRLQVKLLQKIGDVLNIFEDGMVPANPQAPKMQKSPGNRGWYDKPAAS